jgi:hypothetical protein
MLVLLERLLLFPCSLHSSDGSTRCEKNQCNQYLFSFFYKILHLHLRICGIRLYFSKGDKLYHLNHVIQHVQSNEPTARLIIVHCYETEEAIPALLETNCRVSFYFKSQSIQTRRDVSTTHWFFIKLVFGLRVPASTTRLGACGV